MFTDDVNDFVPTSSLAPSRVATPIFTITLPHSTAHTSTTCTQATPPTD